MYSSKLHPVRIGPILVVAQLGNIVELTCLLRRMMIGARLRHIGESSGKWEHQVWSRRGWRGFLCRLEEATSN